MRYAYAITTALLMGGTAATMALQSPSNAQVAQNEPGSISMAGAPKAGAPLSFADLAARLQPAVVNISTTQQVEVPQNPFAGTPFGDLFGGQGQQGGGNNGGKPVTREATSLGSGFIISEDGYIVTNSHVISGGQPGGAAVGSITVTMPDRKEYVAKLVGKDASSDLAVLKIEARGLPFVKFGDSAQTRVGDWIVAIGNPFGLGGSVTAGIVSALHRNTGQGGAYDRYIQTDAAINRGNSGGPMFDLNGNVIGINSAIFSPTGGNVGIGFAIPAELAKPIVDTLRGGARVKRGYLGVQIQPLDADSAEALGLAKNRGELVGRVEPGQGAAKAGIQQGDVITKVNNRDVTPDQTLSYIVSQLPIGSRIPIELVRAGKQMVLTATLAERPTDEQIASISGGDADMSPDTGGSSGASPTRDALGLAVQSLTPPIAARLGVPAGTKGLVIGAPPEQSSDAAAKQFQPGDVILSANQRAVTTPAELNTIVAEAQAAGRSSVLLQMQRGGGRSAYIAVKLKRK